MAGKGFKVVTDTLHEYKTKQLAKDLKLSLAVMVSVLSILFHYVYIMKQLIDNPEMSYQELAGKFAIWLACAAGILYCFVYKVYPVIAGDPIEQRQAEIKKNR